MASLSLRHIYKKYPGGVTAVSDFNLEVKDKDAGGKFDWKDILAGMTFPIILWIILGVAGILIVCFPNM